MKDKFQKGDLVRVAVLSPSPRYPRGRLGLVINKVPDGIEGYDEYKVLFGNSITTWYGQSLEKVKANNER